MGPHRKGAVHCGRPQKYKALVTYPLSVADNGGANWALKEYFRDYCWHKCNFSWWHQTLFVCWYVMTNAVKAIRLFELLQVERLGGRLSTCETRQTSGICVSVLRLPRKRSAPFPAEQHSSELINQRYFAWSQYSGLLRFGDLASIRPFGHL